MCKFGVATQKTFRWKMLWVKLATMITDCDIGSRRTGEEQEKEWLKRNKF